ncbi:MAG: cation transporter [Bacilli bacterium]|nr:cation transporter [Bacilli bacterium]
MHNHKHNHKTEKNILIAFILNISFSIFEIIGGIITGSIAIISDAIHDAGDALSIGISYFLERKSNKKSDKNYTFGYRRYSILGALISTCILLIGTFIVIYNAIGRLINPVDINYNGMIIIAIIGVIINFLAAYYTKDGDSLNQHAVNLHMLEDVLGWVVVLIGSIVIKFTNFVYLDSIMSIVISIYLIIESFKNIKRIMNILLIKIPEGITVEEVKEKVLKIKEVKDVHHVHIWTIDGEKNYATIHVVADKNIKKEIRKKLEDLGIHNVTIELETTKEKCNHKECE